MDYIKIKNYEKYQHYKERHITSWIKLYYSILDDYKISQLTDMERWIWVGILLLYSRVDTHLPLDYDFIRHKICNRNARRSGIIKTIKKFESIDLIYIESTPSLEGFL